ncbi:MAG: hypothetical protein ABW136_02415 [Steroidobacteraceae bacterium]
MSKLRLRHLVPGLLALTASVAQAAEWQLVLLKPPGCGACTYTEELLKRRGFVQTAELRAPGAPDVAARVVRRPSNELTAAERTELAALPYIDPAVWAQHAEQRSSQVLLLRDGKIVAAGNIADSADLRRAEFPETVMAPRLDADPIQVRSLHDQTYGQQFLRLWNVDWFYELALNPQLGAQRSLESWLAARPAPAQAAPPRNFVLLSTATWPGNNEIFNATRITEIQTTAQQSLGVPAANISVLYGSGNNSAPDAVEVRGGRLAFARQPIAGSKPATLPNLSTLFKGLQQTGPSRNLFVFVGHGGPDGAGLWGQLATLTPEDLGALHRTGKGDDVIVSGNCFGGVMARAMSCGFFAARPDIVASGCQADALEVAASRDYLKMFFASVTAEERGRADTDRDGEVTFEEAHWYASVHGDSRNVTYTTLDALADEWFRAHPQDLPARLTVGELHKLALAAPAAEQQAEKRMTDGLTPNVELSLRDLATQAVGWSREQAGVRPMIAQLARRMIYVQRHAQGDAQVTGVRACEARPIAKFLAP